MSFISESQAKDFIPLESTIVECPTLPVRSLIAGPNSAWNGGRSIPAVLTIENPSQVDGVPLSFTPPPPFPTYLSLRNVAL